MCAHAPRSAPILQESVKLRLFHNWVQERNQKPKGKNCDAMSRNTRSHHKTFLHKRFGGDLWWKLLIAAGKITSPMVHSRQNHKFARVSRLRCPTRWGPAPPGAGVCARHASPGPQRMGQQTGL